MEENNNLNQQNTPKEQVAPAEQKPQVSAQQPVQQKDLAYLTKLPDKYRKDFNLDRGKNHLPIDKYPFREEKGYDAKNPSPKSQEYMKRFNQALKKAQSDYDADEENKKVAELFDLDSTQLDDDDYYRIYLAREYGTTPERLEKMGFDGDYEMDIDEFFDIQEMLEDEYGWDFNELRSKGYRGQYDIDDVRAWVDDYISDGSDYYYANKYGNYWD